MARQCRHTAQACAGHLLYWAEAVSGGAGKRPSPASGQIRQARALELSVRLCAELRRNVRLKAAAACVTPGTQAAVRRRAYLLLDRALSHVTIFLARRFQIRWDLICDHVDWQKPPTVSRLAQLELQNPVPPCLPLFLFRVQPCILVDFAIEGSTAGANDE